MRLLLHPRVTLTALVTGLWSFGTGCIVTILTLRPLETFPELLLLRPIIVFVDLGLGVIAVGCLVLCAIGRSILPFVDHDGEPNISRTPAGEPRRPAAGTLQGDPMSNTTPTPQTPFGEKLVGGLMLAAASALAANKATILGDLGSFTPKIDAGIVTVEEDIENKLNPALRAIVTSGFALLNPYIEGEIPTAEEDGFDWLVNELAAEGKKLSGS